MTLEKQHVQDVAACLLVGCFGLGFIYVGLDYRFGSLTRMGPGMFPLFVGIAIVVLSIASAVESVRRPAENVVFRMRPVIAISLAVILWASLVKPAGVAVATLLLVGVSSTAAATFRPVSVLALALVLIGLAYFLFIGLGLPLTLWGR